MHKKLCIWSPYLCLNIENLKVHLQRKKKKKYKIQYISTGHKSRVHCLIRGGSASTGDPEGSGRQRNPPKEILPWVKDHFNCHMIMPCLLIGVAQQGKRSVLLTPKLHRLTPSYIQATPPIPKLHYAPL